MNIDDIIAEGRFLYLLQHPETLPTTLQLVSFHTIDYNGGIEKILRCTNCANFPRTLWIEKRESFAYSTSMPVQVCLTCNRRTKTRD